MAASRRDIAIIGSGCRFPGRANTPSQLWDLLRSPRELAEPIPLDRFSGSGYYHENGQYHGHFNVKEAYFLAEQGAHRRFDASFFGMSPAEATCLDPQCRLLLETVYDALQDAGLPMESLRGSNTAMYTGQMVADYDQLLMRDSDGSLGIYHASGTSHAILSNRISYFFDWHGPSMTIDTACSSSLVAVHQAVQQLRTGNSRVAIAAGSNLIMDPKCFISLSSLNMLSPDGRSKMWDAEANGYARGEGVAAIVLKTLEDALEDGDDIECVIRDTWFAQDGRTQGITSPNPSAQTQMIRDCYLSSGLDPTSPVGRPQFFECHGTGTGAGDAAEAEAITNSFFPTATKGEEAETATSGPLFVGSIKSIVGHTEGTAGVAGVLKVALALRNSTIPANLLFKSLNPRIRPFYDNVAVATTTSPWPTIPTGSPRRASVNSFGFGGANVHAILESYDGPRPQQTPSTPVYAPFVFSAFSSTSLLKYLTSFRDHLLDNRGSISMRDLSFTLHSRRSCLNTAIAITASDEDELYSKITAKLYAQQKDGNHGFVARSSARPDNASGKPTTLGIFTGQGAQWAAMGSDLISLSKTARKVLERMEGRLSRLPDADRPTWSLIEELQKGPESSRIGEAAFSQPLCTAIQILQVDILQASGVLFSAVVGHSSGEIAAAYAAGFLTAEDAICIAYYRGLYAKSACAANGKAGNMLAVGTSAEDARELCDDPVFKGRACVAAVNSSVSVTLSGDHDAIQKLKVILDDEQKFARMLKVDKAYHSHHMEPCTTAYLSSLADLDLEIGDGDRSLWFSSVLAGDILSTRDSSIRGPYWNSNMVNPVLFHQAVVGAVNHIGHPDLVVEVGPHPALKGPVLQTIQDLHPGKETLYTGLFQRGAPAIQSVAEGMGYVWMHLGSNAVDLCSYDTYLSGHTSHHTVKGLPTYAWDHREFWHESRYAQAIRLRPGPVHELLGHMTPDSQEQDMRWRHILTPKEIPWLLGHRIQGQVVFPGAGYVVTALEASMAMCKQLGLQATLIELSDLQFGRALLFDSDDSSIEVIISVSDIKRPSAERLEAHFSYHAADGKGDTSLNLISTASIDIVLGQPDTAALPVRPARPSNLTRVRIEDFYDASREIGYQWGGPFIALDNVERKLGSTIGDLNVVETTTLLVHPATLDAAFQAVLLAYSYPDDGQLWTVHVPRKIRRVTFNPLLCTRQASAGGGSALPFSACHHPDTKDMIGNVDVYTSDSKLPNAMIQVEELECVPFTRATTQDDKEAFAVVTWDLAFPDIEVAQARMQPDHGQQQREWSSSKSQASSKPSHECLAQVVKQITHRSPKLHFLELGVRDMHLIQTIIGKIGTSFSSYTLANVTPEAARSLVPYEQVLSKALDINQNPVEQGFSGAAYDAIILEKAFIPGVDVENVLRNTRTLLKPGGFLLAIGLPTHAEEQTDTGIALESKSREDFAAMLRNAGFSGFDSNTCVTIGPTKSIQAFVWMAQAVDAKISILRDPMSSDHWSGLPDGPLMKHLVILGGATVGTKLLTAEIRGLLQQFCAEITTVNTLTDISSEIISLESTILCLAELDRPVFEDLQQTQWDCIKKMAMEAGSMLWVTRGRRSDVPLSNIIVGLMRSITREIFTINHQILDFESASEIRAQTIAGALLKFRAETVWRQHDSTRPPLETELVVDEAGRFLIPRLKVNDEMNARYNALKRPITRNCKLRDHCIEVVQGSSPSGYELKKVPTDMVNVASKQQMFVTHSLLSAIRVTEFCSLFPMLGKHKESGKDIFALSAVHNSTADIGQGLCMEVDIPFGTGTIFLSLAVCHILSSAVFRGLSSGDVVLVNEPTPAEAEVFTMEAQRIGIDVSFITSSRNTARPNFAQKWITIHPAATERSISRLLPECVSVFVDLSRAELSYSTNRINCLLPSHCRKENLITLFSSESRAPRETQLHELKQCVTEYANRTASMLGGQIGDAELPTIAAGSLADMETNRSPLTIVDWTMDTEVACQLQPIDTQVHFSPHKTYWLVGLSRGLGLALCEWMMRRGARYFAISSRRPAIDAAWLKQMHELGAVIRVCACDVTVKQQVDEVFQDICNTMPPIAGVAQGSMVLEDKAIREMTYESFSRGTEPKVRGSIHLNDCFQSNTLDFFIFFSSVVAVIGRPGQSNYSSGNCFMASLAEQRRRRGLAGSVIHIGPIYGIGYASRLEKAIYSRANFRSTALIPTSERDFYQLFAEAVIAGRPSSSRHSIEILNGVKRVGPYEKDRPVWEAEPLMSHFVKNKDEHALNAEENLSKLPLKAQLAEATDRGRVNAIIREAFLPKICSIFQLDMTKMSQDTLLGMRLDEIGIDSLLAVDIRSWFMKSLEVNIPVLKILSGVAIGDLVDMASETVPGRLLPRLETHVNKESQLGSQDELDSPIDTDTVSVSEAALSSVTPGSGSLGDMASLGSDEKEGGHDVGSDTTSSSRDLRRVHELSFAQEMFWFVWAFIQDKTSLNHVAWARITGNLDITAFKYAVDWMRQSHEILRTAIVEDEGRPVQSIMSAAAWELEVKQIDSVNDVNAAVKYLQSQHVYDVSRGHTIRAMLLSTSPDEHFFVAGLHPLVADGMSFQSLITGVQKLYSRPQEHEKYTVRQFAEFSDTQHLDIIRGRMRDELAFWKTEFQSLPTPLPILTVSRCNSRPPLTVYENVLATFSVGPETKRQIQALCRRYRVTPFHFYLATFRVLLLRFSPSGDGEDICIGVGDANRTDNNMMDVIGPLVNLLPLRLRTQGSVTFSQLLQQTRDNAYRALANSKLPFQALLKELDIPRSASYTSLFQSFVNYRQGLRRTTRWGANGDLALHSVEICIPKVPYDITLEMVDYVDGDCVQTLVLRKDLYEDHHAKVLADSYKRLLESFVMDPTESLDQPDLFPSEEIERTMSVAQGETWERKWPETLVHHIDDIACSRADQVAVVHGNECRTYAEIQAHANAIANSLLQAGIQAPSPVVVLMERSSAWVSSLLGILRVGAVYVPLDLSLPAHRLKAISTNCQPHAFLVDSETVHRVSALGLDEVKMINVSALTRHVSDTTILAGADDAAAILYTSGSSGTPKGIVLKHEGLLNWFEPIQSLYDLQAGHEVVLQQTSPSFDMSLTQVFTALCLGGRLCITSREQRGDAAAICKIIQEQQVSYTCATPSEYGSWLRYGGPSLQRAISWKTALCAGEPLSESLVDKFTSLGNGGLKLFNLYGPTEISITCTSTPVPLNAPRALPVTAGRPLPNYSVYVLDGQLRPVARGVQGEVYVGGAGVSLGYLGNPNLTSNRFIPDCFASPRFQARGWTTLHRTGDLGRWQHDATLVIEGRIDTQVKLRGLRIDLAEIEEALMTHSEGRILEAVVSLKKPELDKPEYLIAHAVFANPHKANQQSRTIATKLRSIFPPYMCPATIVHIEKMPTTTSGKLDRRLISSLELPPSAEYAEDNQSDFSRTENDTRSRLRKVWEEVLDSSLRITDETDFFHVGGSSLLLLDLQKRIKDTFGTTMSLIRMFELSTFDSMAQQIQHGLHYQMDSKPVDWAAEIALSPPLLERNDVLNGTSRLPASEPKVVVLTGVTGRLGRVLVDRMASDPRVKRIHCIGVRDPETNTNSKLWGLDADKVVLHKGELGLMNLGLPDDAAAEVFSEADMVIHAGADKSYLKSYRSLRAANLQSTKTIAELCIRYGRNRYVPIHYISTLSVRNMAFSVMRSLPDFNGECDQETLVTSVSRFRPPHLPQNVGMARTAYGYTASKWASEAFLEKVHQQHPDWPIVIHRPGAMATDQDVSATTPSSELVESLRYYSSIIHALPAVPIFGDHIKLDKVFGLITVGEVASGVLSEAVEALESFDASGQCGGAHLRFVHHVGTTSNSISKSNLLSNVEGDVVIPELPLDEWIRRAYGVGMQATMGILLEDLVAAETHWASTG